MQEGQFVPLRPKDLELLLALVENSGRLIEKDELLRRVWPDSFVEEANLSHHVFTLRRVLGDDREASRYIETVPRRGYRFVAAVKKGGQTRGGSVAVPDDGAPPEQAADPLFIVGRQTGGRNGIAETCDRRAAFQGSGAEPTRRSARARHG